jgi:ribosomal protein S6--L-glutamate ligase
VLILSRNRESYSTRRLRAGFIRRGHQVRVVDTLELTFSLEAQNPRLFFREQPLPLPDAVVPRIGTSLTVFGTAAVRQFEMAGVFCLNASRSITMARDKLRTLQMLSRHDVGIPPTAFVGDRRDVAAAIERVGGAPVILKLLEGTQGLGVLLAETVNAAEAIYETLVAARQQVLIQKFVSESRGRDLRAFVVGDRVVAAMRRTATGAEFRANVHRGGRVESVVLPPEHERVAVRAARILGLHVCGVDLIESADGPLVLEVNASPGLEGIEAASGLDVADAVARHLEDAVLFPEVDLRERLGIGRDYQAVEIIVRGQALLEGKTLADTPLARRDVRVLFIRRGTIEIPNPHGGTQLLQGDRLLCYGRAGALRALMPRARSGEHRRHGVT